MKVTKNIRRRFSVYNKYGQDLSTDYTNGYIARKLKKSQTGSINNQEVVEIKLL